MSEDKVLNFNDKHKTSYCIDTNRRDEQIKIAMRKVRGRIKAEDLKNEPIAIVGYGPSLSKTWEQVKNFENIFTCSGAHKFLIEKGLKPSDFKRWLHNDLDPRPHKVSLLGEPQEGVEYLIASTISPNYLDKLNGFDVKLWHIFATEDEGLRILPPGEVALTGGSDVGMRTMVLARYLGYTDLHIFGMDGSTGDTGFHAAAHPNQPPTQFKTEYNGKVFYTTPALMECAKQMPKEVNELADITVKFYGEGLIQEIMKDYKRSPNIRGGFIAFDKPELISEKYVDLNRKLHESNMAYGTSGSKYAKDVKEILKTLVTEDNPFPSCLDYGCGKGYLQKTLGFPIFEYDPAIPGKEESPKPADLVVCTDVLEHIEPDKLDFVLGDLKRCVKNTGYFVISTRKAVKTYENGENAHLIVKDKAWWEKRLLKYFSIPKGVVGEPGIIEKGSELHVIVVPKIKEELKDVTIVEGEGLKVKFHTPNETTKWRAETIFKKEPVTIEWLKAIPKGAVLFDIGANIGGYSVIGGLLGAQVYSFEPEAENHATLVKNMTLNKLVPNAYCIAISDENKVGDLFINGGGAGQACHSFGENLTPDLQPSQNRNKQGCLSLTLDHLMHIGLPHPDYIKIDVDGLEYSVIKGATKILEKGVKSLIVEINPQLEEHKRLIKELKDLGYSYDPDQAMRAARKDGPFKGVAEHIFTKQQASSCPMNSTVYEHGEEVSVWTPDSFSATVTSPEDKVEHYRSIPSVVVDRAHMETEPYNHLYIENFFSKDLYCRIIKNMPDNYIEIEKSRGTRGYPLRYTADPLKSSSSQIWQEVYNNILEDSLFKNALLKKFNIEAGEYTEDLLLVRDLPGYSIPPHTDSLKKVITVLIYLPEKEIENEGTSIYVPKQKGYTDTTGRHHSFEEFEKVKTMPFKPNSAFIFARTDNSFHGVTPSKHIRNVLLYNINRK